MSDIKIKIGKPIHFQYSDRYYDYSKVYAIKDIFDALVELITNADDSYGRLYKQNKIVKNGGRILIEVDYKRNGQSSQVIVRDRAQGMSLETMVEKLSKVGYLQSEKGDRGFMARGAKDCTAIGDLTYTSIVNDKVYQGKLISNKNDFLPLENGRWATSSDRDELHISKGNGTTVCLDVKPSVKIPLIDTICRDLSYHYALRDILSENSDTEVFIRKVESRTKPIKIIYLPPEGKLVWQDNYEVPSYPACKAKLTIWKSSTLLEDPSDKRFKKSGFIIKSTRAIHECSLLYPGFEKDDLAHHFFGRIDCPYIDVLSKEYEDTREAGQDHPKTNPTIIFDPNRQYGLERKHPFTEALFDFPTKKLKELIEESREKAIRENKEIANLQTKNKLKELAKAASKFLKEQIEELDISEDEEVDQNAFAQKGVLIYPTYPKIAVNQIRQFSFYVNKKLYDVEGVEVSLKADSGAVEFVDKKFILEQHKTKPNVLYGKFKVKGITVAKCVCVQTVNPEIPKAEALFNVVQEGVESRDFKADLEFEHNSYGIKEKSRKILRLFAKYPEVVNQDTSITLTSSEPVSLIIRGNPIIKPIFRSNYAYADILVEARKLLSKSVVLKAKVNEIETTTKIKITQRDDEIGPGLKIELTEKDFNNYRAVWAEREGKPNLLEISVKHPAVSRYVGQSPYEGQNSTEFKILEAEIVAESVCMKALKLETRKSGWLFNWASLKEDETIAETVLTEYVKKMKMFLPIAHSIMLGNK
jgi:hypothetical protein